MQIFRELFGPSREEIWRQLADDLHGAYIDGSLFTHDRVQLYYKEWTITLDTMNQHRRTYTRIRAPFVHKAGFRFTIYEKNIFSDIGKLFGMQDIEIGNPDFDDRYIIKGNDVEKVRALLEKPAIRKLIAGQPYIYLAIQHDEGWFHKDYPDGVDEVYFKVEGIIKDIDTLKSLFDLFSQILDQLVNIRLADDNAPDIEK